MALSRAEFLAGKRLGVGGSDAGAILGLSKFKTPVGVWMEKTGRAKDKESTLPQRFGTFAEDFVAQEYTIETGRQVVRYKPQVVHPHIPFFTGNFDRLVIPLNAKVAAHQGEIRTDRGMEAKAVSAYAGGEWGDDDSDDVPPIYLAQCQWYMGLNEKLRYWDLAALIGNGRFQVHEFIRDDEMIDMLQAKAFEFWNDYVLKDVAPPPTNEADVLLLFPNSKEGKRVTADDTIIAGLNEATEARKAVKDAEKRYDDAKLVLKAFMTDAQELVLPGEIKPAATWKNNKDSSVTEFEKAYNDLLRRCEIAGLIPKPELDGLHAEMLAKYTKVNPGVRKFLIK